MDSSGDGNERSENAGDEDETEESESEEMNAEQDVDEELLGNLEKAVTDNIYNYQSHVTLIETLRNAGELERLRDARERFAGTFPLTPKLWLEWINDERRIDTPWEEIRRLFDKAVQDYLSVDLWLEYVQVACGKVTPEELRELCERALSQAGLHVADGRLLWDAYRLWESALAAATTSDSAEASPSSMDILTQLFKRQVSVPLNGLEDTKQEFIALFGEEKFDSVLQQSYISAIDELRSLTVYETELQSNGHDLATYWRYLDYEEGVGPSEQNDKEKSKEKRSPNVARLRCLYERVITDNCLNVDLWLRYTNWLNKRFTSSASITDVVLPVYERAVRNCPWSSSLWAKYALACERTAIADWPQRAEAIFNRAMKDGGYTSAGEAGELWLTWAYQKRRAADAGCVDFKEVAEVFENGEKFLKDKFGDDNWDPLSTYRRSWASFVACPRKRQMDGAAWSPDLAKARALWKEILGSDGNGRLASVWLEYFNQIERRFGDAKEARKTLHCALNSVTDFPDYVASALKQFELEEGSLRDLDEAEERIRKQAARVEERKKHQQALSASKQKPWAVQKGGKPLKSEFGKPQQQSEVGKQKWQSESKSDSQKESMKRKHAQVEEQPMAKQPRLLGPPRPQDTSQPANGSAWNTKRDQLPKPTLSEAERNRRTIFVSNLSFALKEDQLKEAFESQNIGKVVDVRLKKLASGRSKGFGNVEFEDKESVAKALAIDRCPIEGRPMYISEYKERKGDPTEIPIGREGDNAAAAKYHFGAGVEKHKLFVRNIPKHATEEDLKTIFQPYGELKSIRLVTFPSGQSKGIAYIEYGDEGSASKALTSTDGTFLYQKQLSVAISNPPPRRTDGGRPGFGFTSEAAKGKTGDQKKDSGLMPPPSRAMLPRSLAAATVRKPKLDLG